MIKQHFSQLYESIYADTYRLAYSFTKSNEDAQDAVQNAFVILYKKIETLKIQIHLNLGLIQLLLTRHFA